MEHSKEQGCAVMIPEYSVVAFVEEIAIKMRHRL